MKVYRLSYGNGGIFEEEALEMTSLMKQEL